MFEPFILLMLIMTFKIEHQCLFLFDTYFIRDLHHSKLLQDDLGVTIFRYFSDRLIFLRY